jgi:glycosyltransferase involved in cell wall biosynthesis
MSDAYGGLELYAQKCCEYFQQAQIAQVNVFRHGTPLAKHLGEKTPCHYLPHSTLPSFPLGNARKLAKIIDATQADILHIHWGKDLPLAVLAKQLSRRKPKLVYSRHMHITHYKKDIYHRWLYRQVDQLLAVTQALAKDAKRKLPMPDSAIKPFYLGVAAPSTERINKAEFFAQYNLDPAMFTALILGRIEKPKGQHLVLRALAQCLKNNLPFQVMIIGHAMDDAYLQQLKSQVTQEKLTPYVKFVDFYPQPQTIMPNFDALILATENETFGLVLVEAMRCGIAVIGSNAGGVQEIIDPESTGLLFTPGDANDLAAKITQLIQQPEKAEQLAQAGKEKADRLFSSEKHFTALIDIYKAQLA